MKSRAALIFALILSSGMAQASVRVLSSSSTVSDVPAAAPSAAQAFNPRVEPFDLGAGIAVLKSQAGVALALRAELSDAISLELAGTISHPVSGYAQDEIGGNVDHTESFGETQLAIQYWFYRTGPWSFDVGAGAAVGVVSDRLDENTLLTTDHDHRLLPGPVALLGARYRLTPTFALRADVSYVDFISLPTYGSENYTLSFSGAQIRVMAEVRL